MSDELHPEDRTILATLEALGVGGDASGELLARGSDEAADTLGRLYLETLGLVPYALEPIAPRPGLEESLLAAILGEETQGVGEPSLEALPAVLPEPAVQVAPPAALPVSAPPAEVPAAQAVASSSRPRLVAMPPPAARAGVSRRRWPFALAATLVIGLLGLAVWQEIQVQERDGTIADLQGEIAELKERAQTATSEANRARLDNLELQEKFSLITSPAVQVSSLRPDEKTPLQPEARGVLFVGADHQHWYLSLRNLRPAEGQKAYCLWFINADGPVMSGAFNARPGAMIELSSKQMPAGTTDVAVTLEESAHVSQPAGPMVLKAAAVYQL